MKKRVISAIVMGAIFIPIFIIGRIPFVVAIALLGAQAYREMISLKDNKFPVYIEVFGFLLMEYLIVANSIHVGAINVGVGYLPLALTFLLFGIPAIFNKKGDYTTKDAFYIGGVVLFLGVFFSAVSSIFIDNKWLFLYLVLVAVMTDTFAMLIGCLIGKHKLIPAVSPKKSVEGSVAGSLVATIVGTIYYVNLISADTNILLILAVTLGLSILGQLGDLFFSKIKRENDVKDFSNIMPGHGGVLDRLDSLAFITLFYIILMGVLA